jgi:hypothetical protein
MHMDIERTPEAQREFDRLTKQPTPRPPKITVIDGVDGFTPEMLRVRKSDNER